jgi:Protein of unknown function (DUF2934)
MRLWSFTQAPFSLTQKTLPQTIRQVARNQPRAYEIYLERGGLPGNELDDWLQAEAELERATPPKSNGFSI